MDEATISYSIYLLIAIPVTIWVAKTLYRNGRMFLVDCFHGNAEMADSVSHLLVVGFYLINIGFVTLFLKIESKVQEVTGVFEALSEKLGIVPLVLGGVHFLNLFIFSKLRKNPNEQPQIIPVKGTY
ncbi:hypothetical protein N9Z85_00050 [Akkermansiaceae bacterium]|nr:hypothetical protein [Akkermansiaceae bacterium]MDB4517967.1 hypothetical protein [Akkermansiaceae bacterium]